MFNLVFAQAPCLGIGAPRAPQARASDVQIMRDGQLIDAAFTPYSVKAVFGTVQQVLLLLLLLLLLSLEQCNRYYCYCYCYYCCPWNSATGVIIIVIVIVLGTVQQVLLLLLLLSLEQCNRYSGRVCFLRDTYTVRIRVCGVCSRQVRGCL